MIRRFSEELDEGKRGSRVTEGGGDYECP